MKCLIWPWVRVESTYWPGWVLLSRTRQSPSFFNKFSTSLRSIVPWNHSASCRGTSSSGGCEKSQWNQHSQGFGFGLGLTRRKQCSPAVSGDHGTFTITLTNKTGSSRLSEHLPIRPCPDDDDDDDNGDGDDGGGDNDNYIDSDDRGRMMMIVMMVVVLLMMMMTTTTTTMAMIMMLMVVVLFMMMMMVVVMVVVVMTMMTDNDDRGRMVMSVIVVVVLLVLLLMMMMMMMMVVVMMMMVVVMMMMTMVVVVVVAVMLLLVMALVCGSIGDSLQQMKCDVPPGTPRDHCLSSRHRRCLCWQLRWWGRCSQEG